MIYVQHHLGANVKKNRHVHLVKLSVGTESVDDQIAWQAAYRLQTGQENPRHITRMWPKRGEELLNGGSLYWVIKGVIQSRQRVIGLDEVVGEDGITRCGIVLDPEVIRTTAAPRRPFQGWRYLSAEDAPADLPKGRAAEPDLPPELSAALADIGVR